MNPEKPIVEAYSKGELCNLYKVSYHTLQAWLKPFADRIGAFTGGRYTKKQVRTIFEVIGEP